MKLRECIVTLQGRTALSCYERFAWREVVLAYVSARIAEAVVCATASLCTHITLNNVTDCIDAVHFS